MLRAEGCTEVQGFLISAPQPAENIPALLAKYNPPVAAEPDLTSKLVRLQRKRV
jgi:hypothetical protein